MHESIEELIGHCHRDDGIYRSQMADCARLLSLPLKTRSFNEQWLRTGILEDGVVAISETGTGQGSVASPLLSNVYLHYVFRPLWRALRTS